jgi:hypothetical protein
MTESRFWGDLEFRICGEFEGLQDRSLRYLWCDGISPEAYVLQDSEPRITGRAWIGSSGQEVWQFTLFLPKCYTSRDEIDWVPLIPPNNVTCWVAVDVNRRRIEIEPAVAVPDLDPQANVQSRPS